jgi:ankyrin repeat protein
MLKNQSMQASGIKLLLDHSVKLDDQDAEGHTPIYFAIKYYNPIAVAALLD